MMKSLGVALLLSLFAIICRVNAQTTQPMVTTPDHAIANTQPSAIQPNDDIANLKEKAAQAHATRDEAKRQIISKVEQTGDYQQAKDDLKSAQDTLDDTGNTPEFRMQAAADKSKAKGRMQKLIDDALAADPQIAGDAKTADQADAEYQAALEQQRAAEKAERERQRQAAIDAAFREVTFQQVKLLGVRYVWKPIKMKDIIFGEGSNDEVGELPGVTVFDNGLEALVAERLVDRAAFEKWVGFSATDSDGHTFDYLYADKDTYGGLVADMKSGKHISIRGVVVPLRLAGSYGIVCTKITVMDEH